MTAAKQLFCSWNLDCGGFQLVWREIHGRRRAETGALSWNEMKQLLPRGILLSDAGLPDGGRDFSDAYLPKKAI